MQLQSQMRDVEKTAGGDGGDDDDVSQSPTPKAAEAGQVSRSRSWTNWKQVNFRVPCAEMERVS